MPEHTPARSGGIPSSPLELCAQFETHKQEVRRLQVVTEELVEISREVLRDHRDSRKWLADLVEEQRQITRGMADRGERMVEALEKLTERIEEVGERVASALADL